MAARMVSTVNNWQSDGIWDIRWRRSFAAREFFRAARDGAYVIHLPGFRKAERRKDEASADKARLQRRNHQEKAAGIFSLIYGTAAI